MDFDLRLLRHARALADEGSFARAARAQHLTQPALSRSIQELERRTGLQLFDRSKGGVEPTDVGRIFLAHARELLARAEALDREVSTLRGVGTGALAVGSGTFPTAIFMAEAVGEFLKRNPAVSVRVVNDNFTVLVAALKRRELDLVASALPSEPETAGIAITQLSSRQGCFVVRAGHALAGAQELSLAAIAAFPLVCSGRITPALVERFAAVRKGGATGRAIPDIACESHEMMCHIVSAGDHVLLTTPSACAPWLESGALVLLPLFDPSIVVPFAILKLEGRTLPPIADELVRDIVVADKRALDVDRAITMRGAPRAARARRPVAPASR